MWAEALLIYSLLTPGSSVIVRHRKGEGQSRRGLFVSCNKWPPIPSPCFLTLQTLLPGTNHFCPSLSIKYVNSSVDRCAALSVSRAAISAWLDAARAAWIRARLLVFLLMTHSTNELKQCHGLKSNKSRGCQPPPPPPHGWPSLCLSN